MTRPPPRALLFDVFGTCVDWRSGVARAVAATLAARPGPWPDVDPAAVADAWRARYQPLMETVRSGARPWVDLDVLHREGLDDVAAALGLEALGAADRDALTRAWHRLDPWPDTVPGLGRLRRIATIAPLSNGHVALMEEMARHGGLPWDTILGAEPARAYKPDPAVYLHAVRALGLRPGEAMMVAAHAGDLEAAAALGLRTAFVARPDEHGPGTGAEDPPPGADLVVDDLLGLAGALEAASS
ncbi:MAG: haloacid dehalogenase type II [Thermoleophilia bacterium]